MIPRMLPRGLVLPFRFLVPWIALLVGDCLVIPRLMAQEASVPGIANAKNSLALEGAIMKTIETTSVAAQVAGLLETLEVKEGSRVIAGSDIARVRDEAVRLQVERTRLAWDLAQKKYQSDIDEQVARKNQAVAANEYQRAIDANDRVNNAYPINEIDRLKLILDRSTLETKRASHLRELGAIEAAVAENEYRQNEELLRKHRVIAPCTGMVIAVEKRPGEWVEPGTVVARIVEIDRLRIEGFLLAENASLDLLGTQAKVTVDVSGKVLTTTAELVFISPEVNPLNSQVRVFLEVQNQEGKLRPGLRPKVILQQQP